MDAAAQSRIDPKHDQASIAAAAAALRFDVEGVEHFPQALAANELSLLTDLMDRRLDDGPGTRLVNDSSLTALLRSDGTLQAVARSKLGDGARPVRAILFDKRPESNWALGWHQDRTIAVRARIETTGFGPWSAKAGIVHVEPPFALLENMVTLRAHLDDCGEDNAPLLIVPGSHRLGRIPAAEVSALAERLGSHACLARASDVWLNATTIVHASKASQAPSRRRVLHVDYSAEELPGGLDWLGV